ncbi:MAG: hypothetical protein RL015_2939 [Verrucomicrobiota bacterium]
MRQGFTRKKPQGHGLPRLLHLFIYPSQLRPFGKHMPDLQSLTGHGPYRLSKTQPHRMVIRDESLIQWWPVTQRLIFPRIQFGQQAF